MHENFLSGFLKNSTKLHTTVVPSPFEFYQKNLIINKFEYIKKMT